MEYRFAIRHLGSWTAWEALSNEEDNIPIIDGWRRELNAKLKSDSLRRIMQAAQEETRDALQANKFLLEAPWNKDEKKRAGRPSTESIKQEAERLVDQKEKTNEDYLRIFKTT